MEEEFEEVFEDVELDSEEEPEENVESDSIDYSLYFEDIIDRLETIETSQVTCEQVQVIQDNTYRLYYFIGGLYVAFAIVLAIRFLKIFF